MSDKTALYKASPQNKNSPGRDDKNGCEDILLISPPLWCNTTLVPHALIEMAAYLRGKNVPVDILDVKRDPWMLFDDKMEEGVVREIIAKTTARKPTWVGIPSYTYDYWTIIDMAKRLKDGIPDIKIIVGNVHATAKPDDFIYPDSPIDVACIGEGEDTVFELLNRRHLQLEMDQIKGIAFIKDGAFHKNPSRPTFKDLAHLPRPAYDMLDMNYYLMPSRKIIRSLITSGTHLYSGRGCPYQCTYCASNMLYEVQGLPRSVRYRPVEHVIDTIKWLKETYDIETFYMSDDTFTIDRKRTHAFCEQYIQSGLKMLWACETRVNLVDEELMKHLKAANCFQLDFGVETGSESAAKRMKKGCTVEATYKVYELCHKYNMRTFANVMFNTPGETEEDVKETLECIAKIKANHYGFALTVPLLGTPLFNEYLGGTGFTKEDYKIYRHPYLYNTLVDPRFRMAKHNLDLTKIYENVSKKYYLKNSFIELTSDMRYWKTVLKSKRKWQHLSCVFRNFKRQVSSYSRYIFLALTRGRQKSFSSPA